MEREAQGAADTESRAGGNSDSATEPAAQKGQQERVEGGAHQLADGVSEGGGDGAVGEGTVWGPAEAPAQQQQ